MTFVQPHEHAADMKRAQARPTGLTNARLEKRTHVATPDYGVATTP